MTNGFLPLIHGKSIADTAKGSFAPTASETQIIQITSVRSWRAPEATTLSWGEKCVFRGLKRRCWRSTTRKRPSRGTRGSRAQIQEQTRSQLIRLKEEPPVSDEITYSLNTAAT